MPISSDGALKLTQRSASPRASSSLRRSSGNLRTTGSTLKSTQSATPRSVVGKQRSLTSSAVLDTKRALNQSKKTLRTSVDLSAVENEYIANLQQQIYYLELETEHLREQNQKQATIPTRVTEEADKMVRKIRSLQAQIDDRDRELADRESRIAIAEHDLEATSSRYEQLDSSFASEKRQLVNEIVTLKKQLERAELDDRLKSASLLETRSDIERQNQSLALTEKKLTESKLDVTDKEVEVSRLRVLFEEKRAECVKLQTEYQELEERFFRSEASARENIGRDLKEEIKTLRYDLREKEISAEQDRTLRLKISDDCAAFVKENAALSAQVIELQKTLDAERQFKDTQESRRNVNIAELVSVKDDNRLLTRELEKTQDQLKLEQEKYAKLSEKLAFDEDDLSRAKLRENKLVAELAELKNLEAGESQQNLELRREQMMLEEKVERLQKQLGEKTLELQKARESILEREDMLRELDNKISVQQTTEAVKWEEFARMTDQMKQYTRTMSPGRSSTSPLRNSLSNLSLKSSLKSRSVDLDT